MTTRAKLQFLAAVAILLMCAGCNTAKLPDELIGIWRTDAPGYKDKFMKCDPKFVVLGVGDAKVVPRRVTEIKKEYENNETLYTLKTDEKDEGEYTFAFYYSPVEGGTIRFKNQPQLIWHKRELEAE